LLTKGAAISLERLLDGLDVTFEPLVVPPPRDGLGWPAESDAPPSVGDRLGGCAIFEVAGWRPPCGSTRHSVQVVPPAVAQGAADARGCLSARARAERAWTPDARA
jgi:hypothetical protein